MKRGLRVVGAAVLAAGLQVLFLVALIEGRASVLRDGREVLLEVEPVDPRDLLRGDYVRLGFAISTLDRAMFGEPDRTLARGTAVMVRLAPGEDGLWDAVGAWRVGQPAPPPDAASVEMAGRIDAEQVGDGFVGVTYGIERFYLPEGQGLAIERDLSVRPFRVLAAVAGDGRAQIKGFFDGEVRLFEEPFY